MAKPYPCKGCVPPKRHPACHDHCPEYLKMKKEEDMRKHKDAGRDEARNYTVSHLAKNADFNSKKRKQGRLTYSRKG